MPLNGNEMKNQRCPDCDSYDEYCECIGSPRTTLPTLEELKKMEEAQARRLVDDPDRPPELLPTHRPPEMVTRTPGEQPKVRLTEDR